MSSRPEAKLTATITAGCKINLGLRITGRRPDGYHEISSLFWPLPEPHDRLTLRCVPGHGLTVRCDHPEVCPESNTLTRAHAALAALVPELPGLHITLHKGIPVGAGLGGGSSDAAALLLWYKQHLPSPLDDRLLHDVALRVGADTPFFLQKAPRRVRGIGDILEPVDTTPFLGCHCLLVCPPIHASTSQAYADYDRAQKTSEAGQNALTNLSAASKNASSTATFFADALYNDLEPVVVGRHPELVAIKTALSRLGAVPAMSGSGSSMFGLFAPEEGALAAKALHALRGNNWRMSLHTLENTGM